MVLFRIFKPSLIATGMTFLFLASLNAESIDIRIIRPKVDKVLITRDQFLNAVQSRSFEVVKIALSQGMDINTQNDAGESALHLVNDVALAEYLIARGADVNLRDKQFKMTPLFFQEVPVAKLLVAAGADVNAQSHQGNTPLIWLAYSNYLEGIRYLVSVGADIHAVNDDGKTVLDIAEHFGGPELVEYLRSIGAGKKHK